MQDKRIRTSSTAVNLPVGYAARSSYSLSKAIFIFVHVRCALPFLAAFSLIQRDERSGYPIYLYTVSHKKRLTVPIDLIVTLAVSATAEPGL